MPPRYRLIEYEPRTVEGYRFQPFEIRLTIENCGDEKGVVWIINYYIYEDGRRVDQPTEYEALEPGETRTVTFTRVIPPYLGEHRLVIELWNPVTGQTEGEATIVVRAVKIGTPRFEFCEVPLSIETLPGRRVSVRVCVENVGTDAGFVRIALWATRIGEGLRRERWYRRGVRKDRAVRPQGRGCCERHEVRPLRTWLEIHDLPGPLVHGTQPTR